MTDCPFQSLEPTDPKVHAVARHYPIERATSTGAVSVAIIAEMLVCAIVANCIDLFGIGVLAETSFVALILIVAAAGLVLGVLVGAAAGGTLWLLVTGFADAFKLLRGKYR